MTVISQPRYLPALNYLQRLFGADTFIILDSVQRQSRGFENRNKLIINGSPAWLTIPIVSSSREIISNTLVKGEDWIEQHQAQIHQSYKSSCFFDDLFLRDHFKEIRRSIRTKGAGFTEVILDSYRHLSNHLGLQLPRIELSSNLETGFDAPDKGPEKLLWLCHQTNAKLYVSGPNGLDYRVHEHFSEQTIPCRFHHFDHPRYQQHQLDTFQPYLGFIDALFQKGPDWLISTITTPLTLKKA